MDNIEDLFDFTPYPYAPGHRGRETSVEAAKKIAPEAPTLQAKVLAAIEAAGSRGLTTNECADVLQIDKGSIQPRTSELRLKGQIIDSGMRRRNQSGVSAIVWTVKDGAYG